MVASAATAATGLSVFVVSGAWLDEAYRVSTLGLGLIAAAFGAIELVSSSTVALAGDRIGSRRSVVMGLLLVAVGLATILLADTSRTLAVVGLLIFLAGFEFALVSSLTLVTEAAPDARGRAIGVSNAVSTIARAGSVFVSGQLFESFGMTGPVALAFGTGTVALASTVTAMRSAKRDRVTA
jgi:DHA1 family inner membrane transport protein